MDFASMAMQWMAMYALLDRLLPPPLRQWIDRQLEALWERLLLCSNPRRAARTVKLKVPEKHNGYNVNHFYKHALRYLATLHEALQAQDNLEVIREEEDDDDKDEEDEDTPGSTYFRLPHGQVLDDRFDGMVVRWRRQKEADGGAANNDNDNDDDNNGKECITLEFAGADRRAIIPHYLNHISRTALEMQHRRTQLYLYHNHGSASSSSWDCVAFNHPSTFENLALDPELRRRIVDDLRSFCRNQRVYRRLGRAWKRGYLLHGPPGTGKTSLIAAIANLLHYDVYDLELTSVHDNAQLKSLLVDTSRKSLVVIEDIDCAFASRGSASPSTGSSNDSKSRGDDDDDGGEAHDDGADDDKDGGGGRRGRGGRGGRSSRSIGSSSFTLSGLLNFADGLWSGCAEERIFIFTTNFKERLDPALLRPGRMDMHIHLSYCSMPVVEQLAHNYLGLRADSHPQLFAQLETVVKASRHSISPAALAEIFISHYHADRPELALQAALQAFKKSSSSSSSSSSASPSSSSNKHVQESLGSD